MTTEDITWNSRTSRLPKRHATQIVLLCIGLGQAAANGFHGQEKNDDELGGRDSRKQRAVLASGG